MNLKVQKKLAAEVLKVGIKRVRFDNSQESLAEIEGAITKEDIRRLIRQGKIWKIKEKGVSRGRARERAEKRKKGRQRGHGSRKGTRNARFSKGKNKKEWIIKIRALRKKLRELRDKGYIERKDYRYTYRVIKSGSIKDRAHLMVYLREKGMLKEKESKGA